MDRARREEGRRGEVVIPVHEVLTYCMHAKYPAMIPLLVLS